MRSLRTAAALLPLLLFALPAHARQTPAPAAGQDGRLVEAVIIEGNRRLTDEQLLEHIGTRPGDRFKEADVRRDLQKLLELGTLDTAETRVSTEAGPRGGVVIIFNVNELPVIRDISFKGLESASREEALAALAEHQPGVRPEGVYNPAHVKGASDALLKLLAARGRRRARVAVETSVLSATSVELTFVVKEGRPARKDDRPGRWF